MKLRLFRGQGSHNNGSDGSDYGRFYHPDPEFARQFTQSGRIEEVIEIVVDDEVVYRPETLPYAGDPDTLDETVAEAKRADRKFKAIWASEGTGGDPSVYFFDKSGIPGKRRRGIR